MPRSKKEPAKKAAAPRKPRVKRAVKKEKPASKAKPITIDVIADDEEVLFRDPPASLPADDPKLRAELDAQKKYFSELVTDMKQKNDNPKPLYGTLPAAKGGRKPAKKSISLYRRIAYQFVGLTVILLLAVGYFFLPSLKITMHPTAEAIADSLSIRVAPGGSESPDDSEARQIEGTVVTMPIAVEASIESSGEEILGEEVVGTVTLKNDYSKSQPLVANTRLLSADNKLFRLKESATIPAGGSVEAEVYADKPSLDMAISATRFTIPGLWLGLQDQIYAVSEKPFEYRHQVKRYIRQRDLDQAVTTIKTALKDKAQEEIDKITAEGKVLAYSLNEDAASITLSGKLGDETESFTVTAAGELAYALFPKDQAESLVKAKIAFLLPDDKKLSSFDSNDVEYRLDTYDTASGTASISANFKGNMSLRTDSDIIDRKKLVNLNERQINEYLSSFPEIQSYDLEFFPEFIRRAPSLADRIKVEVK
ncbi:MAG: hypothetical protein ACM3PZ_03075 [Bacillota bacterium]